MITCVLIINSQYDVCDIICSDNKVKSLIFRLYTFKNIRHDNAGEFMFQAFEDSCISTG